jgi:hypothetical protein
MAFIGLRCPNKDGEPFERNELSVCGQLSRDPRTGNFQNIGIRNEIDCV